MAFRYSGTMLINIGEIVTFSDETKYSFKTTEGVMISIGRSPFAFFGSGEEVVIKQDDEYVFDRDTTILYSYAEIAAPPPQVYENSCPNNATGAGWITCCSVTISGSVDEYRVTSSLRWWNAENSSNQNFRVIRDDNTVIIEHTQYCPAQSGTIVSFDGLQSEALSAGDILYLQGYADDAYSGAQGSQYTTTIRVDEI